MYRYKTKEIKYSRIKRFFCLSGIIICVAIITILLHNMYLGIEVKPFEEKTDETNVMITRKLEETKNKNKEISEMIENVSHSIVGISKIKNTGTTAFISDSTTQLGLGTGVIVTDNGYIVTNEHVSGKKYSSCYVTLESGKTYNGNVIWADSEIDLSIVKINANALKYAVLGDSDNAKVADSVYAIGNPIGFEFQRTVTSGIVSALNRTVKINENNEEIYMEDLIQTDATINPGNSGGPLINLDGEVIGINSVKITSAEGIGFAIPINVIKPVVEKIVNNKPLDEPYLGIFGYDKEAIPYLNSDLDISEGVYIAQVVLDGPSNKAGLKTGDIITQVDNTKITKMSELRRYIYSKSPNDTITVNIIRNNKKYAIQVSLSKKS